MPERKKSIYATLFTANWEEIVSLCFITLIIFLILIYLAIFSGLLSGSSSGGLGFSLVFVSTSVLINGHRDFVWFSTSLCTQISTSAARMKKITILSVRSLRCPWLLSHLLNQTDSFSRLNKPIRELLKRSAKGQVFSIITRVTFHDSSSNELPLNFWIHIFYTYFTKLIGV